MQAKKKIHETDAIFARLSEVNAQADRAEDALRISIDTKATVKIGLFSRGGKSWVEVKALDHDFGPELTMTPFGILLPQYDDLYIYFTHSMVTSDFIVDVLDRWWRSVRRRFEGIKTLLINQDNGPENNSRRTQFMNRMVDFAHTRNLHVRLGYYPPYHSKYNPVERCWGALENHWNGDVLDHPDVPIEYAKSMTWNGKHPIVNLITKSYCKGVKLTAKEMQALEAQIDRLAGLEKWFVDIPSQPRTAA